MEDLSLEQIYELLPNEKICISFFEFLYWYINPKCAYCKSVKRSTHIPKENRYHCNNCGKSFSVTTGTIFHRTRIPLQKWLFLYCNLRNGRNYSARELAGLIKVNKNTAHRMLQKIHLAFYGESELAKKYLENLWPLADREKAYDDRGKRYFYYDLRRRLIENLSKE